MHLDAPTGIIFTSGRRSPFAPDADGAVSRISGPRIPTYPPPPSSRELSCKVKPSFRCPPARQISLAFPRCLKRVAVIHNVRERVARGKKLHVPDLIRFEGGRHAPRSANYAPTRAFSRHTQPLFRFTGCGPRGATVALTS